MSKNSLINAYLSKPFTNIIFESEDNKGICKNVEKNKTKDIKKEYNNISSGVRVFKSIIKKDLNLLNIKEFIVFIQWKYPTYSQVEITKYLQSVEWFEQDKKIKSNNLQTSLGYLTVKALKDIPVFVGYDGHDYKLNIGDVVSVPRVNAFSLIKHKLVVEMPGRAQEKPKNISLPNTQEIEKYFIEVWQKNHGPVNSINLVKFCMDCASHLKLTTDEIKPIAVKLFIITPKKLPEKDQSSKNDQLPEKQDYVLIETTEEADQVVKGLKESGY